MTEKIKFSQLVFPEGWEPKESHKMTETLYKSIVIDRDNRDFKIITGDFDSKKSLIDFYDSDYIVKRVFLKDVFDWIPKHSKSPLDSYLMYSIAVSKWKNNNMLKDYYTQLIHDIPDADNLDEAVGDTTLGKALQQSESEDPIVTDNLYVRPTDSSDYGIFATMEDMEEGVNPIFTLSQEELNKKIKSNNLPNEMLVQWSE